MNAVEYQREKIRLCKAYEDKACDKCPLYAACDNIDTDSDPEEAVDIVTMWAKEHPRITNGDKVKELLENHGYECIIKDPEHVSVAFSREWWNKEV